MRVRWSLIFRYTLAAALLVGVGTLGVLGAANGWRTCNCAGGYCSPEQDDNGNLIAWADAAPPWPAANVDPKVWLQDQRPLTPPTLPSAAWLSAYPVATPRTYAGDHLGYVMMPLGGIGTGTIWVDGQGRLAIWQIFNGYDENPRPDNFFAIRASVAGEEPVTRVLQTVAQSGLTPMDSLTYEGRYPIARLNFTDAALPVTARLEAYNPEIPTDTANSSLPCVIFRFTARNDGKVPAQVQILGALRNMLATPAAAGYNLPGGPVAEPVTGPGAGGMFLHQPVGPLASGLIQVRGADGVLVPGPRLLWLQPLGDMVGAIQEGSQATTRVEILARYAKEGGGVVAAGITPQLISDLAAARQQKNRWEGITVFEDFEKPTYEGWTVHGPAFGKGPAHGTIDGQQPVSGYIGNGLVNSYLGGDGPQGEMISKDFTIAQRYIGFLLGGGDHPGQECLNLVVDGQIVRTQTGRNEERLLPYTWDVADLKGKTAHFEIIDHNSEGWGHINVDELVFSDRLPEVALSIDNSVEALAAAFTWPLANASDTVAPAGAQAKASDPALLATNEPWPLTKYVKVDPFDAAAAGLKVLATAPDGSPLILSGPLGKATLTLCMAQDIPWSWADALLRAARGEALPAGARVLPTSWNVGSMALTSPDAGVVSGAWSDPAALAAGFAKDGAVPAAGTDAAANNAAVIAPLTIPPGAERTATFVLSWHFPNVDRLGGHSGNYYTRKFADALAVGRYADANAAALWARTRLYHDTMYQSNLPPEWVDAITSQSVIFRGPTCWQSEDGYFAGFEGSYGCCPLNCTHVWNYAQAHARLFPEIGRNLRRSDLLVYMKDTGETSHRQHQWSGAFIDGQCAIIEATYREYQLSPDGTFLNEIYPSLKKAMDWLIERIDPAHAGVPTGAQANTYDCAVSGDNTFIGSQYLSALAASAKMAAIIGDKDSADRWNTIREAGSKAQDAQLWKDEFYIQIPDAQHPASDYDTGCHSDQLLGQWWAHQLNLGYLYPPDHVKTALASVMKYNFRTDFVGFVQKPRRYIPDNEGGLLICTWPNEGRPGSFTNYSDEVWTGIEYATAGEMIWEGQIDNARKIVAMARSRYDGVKREGLNSGPGGNPFNDLECGKFYARAMSSWGLLIAAQGLILDGPAGVIGFKPNWQPADHRSFFTAPEGWGLFVQKRQGSTQTDRLELRYGRLQLNELVFALPAGAGKPQATVTLSGKRLPVELTQKGEEVRLQLHPGVTVKENDVVQVEMKW
jgi:uncharacterized protein (DUF608 family)